MHPLVDEVIYTKRRSIALEITQNAKLIVRSPKRVDHSWAFKIIEAKRNWIEKNKSIMQSRLDSLSGVQVIEYSKDDIEEASRIIEDRLYIYSNKMDLPYNSFKISNAKKRWGVCCRKSDIRINWRLAKADESILDYVIVHELAHIKEKNHSKRFWALVAQYIPDYKTRRKTLKQFGHVLHARYN